MVSDTMRDLEIQVWKNGTLSTKGSKCQPDFSDQESEPPAYRVQQRDL